jgi:hypothetical protein
MFHWVEVEYIEFINLTKLTLTPGLEGKEFSERISVCGTGGACHFSRPQKWFPECSSFEFASGSLFDEWDQL